MENQTNKIGKIKYKLLSDDSPERLARLVNEFLEDGWELCGGPAVDRGGKWPEDRVIFVQAMIKKS